jgi:hypothetical protein
MKYRLSNQDDHHAEYIIINQNAIFVNLINDINSIIQKFDNQLYDA